jgi:hypothetical protein
MFPTRTKRPDAVDEAARDEGLQAALLPSIVSWNMATLAASWLDEFPGVEIWATAYLLNAN